MTAAQLRIARDVLHRELGSVENLTQIAGGVTSAAFAFRHDGRDLVLRLSEWEQNFRKDAVAARHATAALPIAQVLSVGSVGELYYAISVRAFGRTIETMDEQEMRASLPALFAGLDALREADTSEAVGYGIWFSDGNGQRTSWQEHLLDEDWAAPFLDGWRDELPRHDLAQSTYLEALAVLRELVPRCPERRDIVHADLLNNTLFDAGRLTALFDWGSVMYGDFVYDLAWMLLWAPKYDATRNIDLLAQARAHYAGIGLRVENLSTRLLAYQLAIGLAGLRFNAFCKNSEQLDWIAARLHGLLEQLLRRR